MPATDLPPGPGTYQWPFLVLEITKTDSGPYAMHQRLMNAKKPQLTKG